MSAEGAPPGNYFCSVLIPPARTFLPSPPPVVQVSSLVASIFCLHKEFSQQGTILAFPGESLTLSFASFSNGKGEN